MTKMENQLSHSYFHNEPVGEEIRFSHEECNDTRDRLYVKRTRTGYLYHCHNCGLNGWVHGKRSLSPKETLQALEKPKKNQVVKDVKLNLPHEFTTQLSPKAQIWLEKYGITDDEANKFRFGMLPHRNRLLLPVYDSNDSLVYYQTRYLDKPTKQNPKYLNVRASGAKNVFFICNHRATDLCILVEDILSAIKVGRQVDSIALLGSYIPPRIVDILQGYARVCIWLDPDKRAEALKYSKQLNALLGVPVTPIISPKDPKEHSNVEIATFVQ